MVKRKKERFTSEQKLNFDLRHYPVRPHVGVGGIICWKDYVVIIKRKYNPNQGKWAIPGGHLKLGERASDGALRECIEETGLLLEVGKLASVIDKIDYDSTGKIEYHYVLCDYWMIIPNAESFQEPPQLIPQSDVIDARFVHFKELPNYELTPTVRKLFKNLKILK
ncbi:NUDIX hydrolase [Candidatus Harpocratesius sp.]